MSDASGAAEGFQPQKGSRGPRPKNGEADPPGQGRGNGAARGKGRGDGFSRKPREPRPDGGANGRGEGAARPPRGANANGDRKPKNQGDRKPKQPRESSNEDPKLTVLKQSTQGYFGESALVEALRKTNGDVDAALSVLNAQRGTSWSGVVSKAQSKPFIRVERSSSSSSAPAAAPAAAAVPAKSPSVKEKPAPKEAPAPVPPPVDPEKHIEALTKQIDEAARETESRAQQLKNIQGEIQSIQGPRDSRIEQLVQDRSHLLVRQQMIREELVKIDAKVKEIDQEVEQIKRDKIEKIAVLEQTSKALLAEMKRK